MVATCIADLKERNGSSQAAIKKYFEDKRASKAWDLPETFGKTLSLQLKRCAALPSLRRLPGSGADVVIPMAPPRLPAPGAPARRFPASLAGLCAQADRDRQAGEGDPWARQGWATGGESCVFAQGVWTLRLGSLRQEAPGVRGAGARQVKASYKLNTDLHDQQLKRKQARAAPAGPAAQAFRHGCLTATLCERAVPARQAAQACRHGCLTAAHCERAVPARQAAQACRHGCLTATAFEQTDCLRSPCLPSTWRACERRRPACGPRAVRPQRARALRRGLRRPAGGRTSARRPGRRARRRRPRSPSRPRPRASPRPRSRARARVREPAAPARAPGGALLGAHSVLSLCLPVAQSLRGAPEAQQVC